MNILEEIKATEQKAAEIRREAQQKAREFVRDKERATDLDMAAIIEKAEEASVLKLSEATKMAEEKAKAFLDDGAKKDEEILAAAESKLDAAVSYITKSAGDVR